MTYQLKIEQKSSYLHITVTGKNSKDNVMAYHDELFRECVNRNCARVLIEECLEGPRLNLGDVFDVASRENRQAMAFFNAIAYVDVNSDNHLMQFAETVAVNRAMPVTVFASVAEAEQWLQERSIEQ